MNRESGSLTFLITGEPFLDAPDWHSLLQLAGYHRLTPQLARATRNHSLPPDIRTAIDAASRATVQQNLLLFAHTASISAMFRDNGIDALALKGPVLAHQLYGDLSMRVCGDVDLLVRAEDFNLAARMLAANGYHADLHLDDAALHEHLRHQHDLAFAHPDGTLVELHAQIAQPHYSYGTDLRYWFGCARTSVIAGREIRTPSAEHALVLAIVHGTKHVWTRLDLLADVAGLARQPLEWELADREFGRLGARRAAAVTGFLLEDLLSLRTPLLTQDRVARRIAYAVAARLRARSDPTYWQSRLFDVVVRERAADRLRYATNLYRKWSAR